MRKEFILEIPADSVERSIMVYNYRDDVADEILRAFVKDPNNVNEINKKIKEFLLSIIPARPKDMTGLAYYGNNDFAHFYDSELSELINNSYDSFYAKLKNNMNSNENLIIKIVVIKDEKNITFKVADNGSGFINQPKSQFFKYNDIRVYSKQLPAIGGCGAALYGANLSITSLGGTLFFKNRKDAGASIYITAPISTWENTDITNQKFTKK